MSAFTLLLAAILVAQHFASLTGDLFDDADSDRNEVLDYEEFKAVLPSIANRKVILTAGSLRTDDGRTKTGSVLLLDLPTRAEAEAFFANDPATKAGMRGKTEIRWLNVAILDRTEQP